MKSLIYILLAILLIVTYGCKEDEHPYVGYIVVNRAVIDASQGSSTVITADTDIDSPIKLTVNDDAAAWCSVSVNGKEITITALQANTSTENYRTATISVRCGYRVTSFTVLQKFEGQQYLEYDWTKWSAYGSDVQSNDGGGYPSLFTESRSTFWHSQYSPKLETPLPHWLVIDMQEELQIAMVRVARRNYAGNGNNYPSVKTMEVYTSSNAQDFTKVGEIHMDLPWTAPDGTIVTGNSPLIPAYDDVMLTNITTARYVKLIITETNNTTGACQVAYFKAFGKI